MGLRFCKITGNLIGFVLHNVRESRFFKELTFNQQKIKEVMIWTLGSIYILFSTILVGLGAHAYSDGIFGSISEVSEEQVAEGPQEVANLLGVDLEYKPRFNDWPNVIDPSLQYWPRNQTLQ